jgi:hypothetical protein
LGEQYRWLSSSLCSFLYSPITSPPLVPNILNILLWNTISLHTSLSVSDTLSINTIFNETYTAGQCIALKCNPLYFIHSSVKVTCSFFAFCWTLHFLLSTVEDSSHCVMSTTSVVHVFPCPTPCALD